RIAAGREGMSRELQALCFLAGANSIFVGGKLLTTPLPGMDEDSALLRDLGLRPMRSPGPLDQSHLDLELLMGIA
ncbi:MAG: bioB, partial [Caulobacter sp.]|nr:bioB [Caulobacter sp.]